jgi:hypothetical protein
VQERPGFRREPHDHRPRALLVQRGNVDEGSPGSVSRRSQHTDQTAGVVAPPEHRRTARWLRPRCQGPRWPPVRAKAAGLDGLDAELECIVSAAPARPRSSRHLRPRGPDRPTAPPSAGRCSEAPSRAPRWSSRHQWITNRASVQDSRPGHRVAELIES